MLGDTIMMTSKVLVFNLDFLVVAGGSGGVYSTNSGGGAGGLRTSYGSTSGGGASAENSIEVTSGDSFTVTVGGGGPHFNASNISSPSRGENSVFGTVTSLGGGVSLLGNDSNGIPWKQGGSGTGGSYGGTPAGPGTAGQGFAGGSLNGAPNYKVGGAGGAGSVGEDASGGSPYSGRSGNGGDGLAVNILGVSNALIASVGEIPGGSSDVFYGGGGGSGSDSYRSRSPGSGGIGGGGSGGYNSTGTSGIPNTGGGGGGGANRPSNMNGGNGGSGVVILRYPSTVSPTLNGLTESTGSPFTEGSDNITVITAGSGTITF
jgi:hypothetical protein